MRGCVLCKVVPAKTFCDSDQAALCWDCDAKVHGANFLVARHSRTLLCHACQRLTPWTASGAKLGHTVSVCDDCVNGVQPDDGAEEGSGGNDDMPDDGDEDRNDNDDDSSEDENEGTGEDGGDGGGGGSSSDGGRDEDGDNQVVPWSSLTHPPAASSSSDDESVSQLYMSNKRGTARTPCSTKRTREGSSPDSRWQEDLGDSSSRRNRGPKVRESASAESHSTGKT
ncbi:hypothetical protein SAY86_005535 [Trapa natans]|uniref:B box-type domain-containing protein n=1 Tax=Trapa natans TaxID=22666 RepID=A0AAN7L071_TRANT|nr:hypothetical protein SAY86_005535 [Trapa natans]